MAIAQDKSVGTRTTKADLILCKRKYGVLEVVHYPRTLQLQEALEINIGPLHEAYWNAMTRSRECKVIEDIQKHIQTSKADV